MTSAVFDKLPVSLMSGTVNIGHNDGKTFCMLLNAAPTKATDQFYSDIGAKQIADVGSDYTAGGAAIHTELPTCTSTVTGLKTGASLVFTTTATLPATGSITYAVIQQGAVAKTTATNPLICYIATGTLAVTNGTITFDWAAAGIMTTTSAAAI